MKAPIISGMIPCGENPIGINVIIIADIIRSPRSQINNLFFKKPIIPTDTKNNENALVKTARINPGRVAPIIKRFAPVAVDEKRKGTRNVGKEYFHACIIDPNGLPPVTAAAAEGDSPTGGDTSDRTAK